MDTLNKNKFENTLKEELGNNTISLCISLFTFLVICYFIFSYIKNLLEIIKNYIHESLLVNQTNKKILNDNNNYDHEFNFESNRNEILKSINNIKNNYNNEFNQINNYKDKTNKEYRDANKNIILDTNIYSSVNSKVLSKKYDNYDYDNTPSIFQFILDIFKPSTV
jgi:hypothetical protein|tara:strand:+ start:6795 stop:7292 length:498 start_codon:yes stop_codon:yes gene_type:complete